MTNCKEKSLNEIAWEELKKDGSAHYKTGGVEPLDLYRSMGILRPFCIASIIKYAARNAGTGKPEDNPVSNKDCDKMIHYAKILKVACGEWNEDTQNDRWKNLWSILDGQQYP